MYSSGDRGVAWVVVMFVCLGGVGPDVEEEAFPLSLSWMLLGVRVLLRRTRVEQVFAGCMLEVTVRG